MQWTSTLRIVNKGGADANAQAQEQFYNSLTANYKQDFGQFQSLMSTLSSQITGLMNGTTSTPYGYGAAEDAALRSSAANSTGQSYAKAQQALNGQLATQGGGNIALPSGAADQLRGNLAASSAGTLANLNTGITLSGYQTGRENYLSGLQTEMGQLSALNPNAFAGAATSAGNSATNAIQVANMSDLGGWGSVLGSALGGGISALTGGLMGGGGGGGAAPFTNSALMNPGTSNAAPNLNLNYTNSVGTGDPLLAGLFGGG